MKIQITFKTPDVLDPSIDGLTENEKDEVILLAKKWIEYDEYVQLELDTEKGTCTVLPV